MSCHPRLDKRGGKRGRPTCFNDETLDKIYRKQGGEDVGATAEDKWRHIKGVMSGECGNRGGGDDVCVVGKLGGEDGVEVGDQYRPLAPRSWRRNKPWLSTSQIGAVMEQYEETYPSFLFIGPTPIDWYLREGSRCLVSELCGVKQGDLRKDYRWLGVVFNLDPHTEDGSHWVAVMVDLRKPAFYQYDSYGYPPEKEIRQLQCMFGEQMSDDVRGKYNLYWNSNRHQWKNTECGMYSIQFLVRMLKGDKFGKICDTMPGDDEMVGMRGEQFNF